VALPVLGKPARSDHKLTYSRGKIMATADSSTVTRAPVSVPDLLPFDALAFLLDSYEALAELTSSYSPHSPVQTLLDCNNRHFRLLIDDLNRRGLLS
jgi:hypothetical protein